MNLTSNGKLRLSPPWEEYANKVKALFAGDQDVEVEVYFSDPAHREIVLRVQGSDKAEALGKVLPQSATIGGALIALKVVPANTNKAPSARTLLERAFAGNALFDEAIETRATPAAPGWTFAMFKPVALQFWNDNLGDPNGNTTILAADVAREICGTGALEVRYSTSAVGQ